MRRRFLSCAVAVVAAGAIYLVHAVGADASAPASPRSEPVDPEPTIAQAPGVAAPAAPTVVAAAPAGDAEADGEQLDTTLARAFDRDRVDPAWAAATERAIADAFVLPALAGSTLERLACRGVICRLEVTHADEPAQRRFLGAAGTTPGFRGAGAARSLVDPDHPEHRRTLVYVLREGEQLPALN
ncbi:MAG: hypothetical protein ABI867_22615 [Kofleriaceae bacterium]